MMSLSRSSVWLDELPVGAPDLGAFSVGDVRARSLLLLLFDPRLPTAGLAHSGGIEVAVAQERVSDQCSLASYLEGRLATTGYVDAALSAATALAVAPLDVLSMEATARCCAPALRMASKAQARGLLRSASHLAALERRAALDNLRKRADLLWPIALGVVVRELGLSPIDAALIAAQSSVTGPAWAAVRLLGLDPFPVVAHLASLAPLIDDVARRAEEVANVSTPAQLPAFGSPLVEISAQTHAKWEVRLFVS